MKITSKFEILHKLTRTKFRRVFEKKKKERFYITRHFRGESIFRLICITADLIYNHGSKRNIIWNHQRFGHTQHKHEEVQGYGGGVIKKENKTCWKIDVVFCFVKNSIQTKYFYSH